MHEFGIETSILQDILKGRKTIEVRLGKPDDLAIRAGDTVSIRDDLWIDGKKDSSIEDTARIKITQILYFETFEEMLSAVDFTAVIPDANSKAEALKVFRKFYSPEDEYEYGVVAFYFELI